MITTKEFASEYFGGRGGPLEAMVAARDAEWQELLDAAVDAEREHHLNPEWTCQACGAEQRGFIVCGMCGKNKPLSAPALIIAENAP